MFSKRCALGLAASLVVGAPAVAADSIAAATPGAGLEEVVVTARKRTEDIKEIPSAVSVLSAELLRESHIEGIEDITRATPGVSFGSGGGPNLDNIEVRGVSSNSGSATVGLYMDEVSITEKNLFNGQAEPKLFDIDRVEVLRGPQGTLYGASSMGGTIRFISNKPDLDQFSVTVDGDLSGTEHGGVNYDDKAVVNLPIVPDKLALRLGVDIGEDSGYIDHYTPAGQLAQQGVNSDRWDVLRASALLKTEDGWQVDPALFAEHEVTDDTSVYYPLLGLYEQDKLVREPSRNNIFIPSVTVTKDFGWSDLTSVSSYFWQQLNRTEDGTVYNSQYLGYLIDSDPPNGITNQGYRIGDLPGPEITRTSTAVTTEEVRLSSKSTAESGIPVTWIVGLFYSDYQIHKSDDAYVLGLDSTFEQIYGMPPQDSNVFAGSNFPGDSVALSDQRLEERQFAAFGDFTWDILPSLKGSAGIRYAYARSGFTNENTGFFGTEPPVFSSNARFYAATPRFSLTYDVSDEATLYTTAAKGFRLGGSEGVIPTPLCSADLSLYGLNSAPTTYGSDKLWSYEGGVKGRFLDNRLSVNADVYYIEWQGIQQTIALPTCGYAVTTNVGNAESYGTELEVAYRPIPNLTIGASGDLSRADLTSVTGPFAQVGDKVLNVPDWMAILRASYSLPFGDALVGFIRADYDWTGRSHGSFNPGDPDYIRPVYAVLNGSIGVDVGDYTVSLYAKNLLDNSKAIQHPSILFNPEAYTLRPLTVGLNVKATF